MEHEKKHNKASEQRNINENSEIGNNRNWVEDNGNIDNVSRRSKCK